MPGNTFKDRKLASEAGKKSKGGKHLKTKQWEALGEFITGYMTDRVLKYVNGQTDKEAFQSYLLLLEYFKPKLSRAEIQAEVKTEIKESILKAFDEIDDEAIQQKP